MADERTESTGSVTSRRALLAGIAGGAAAAAAGVIATAAPTLAIDGNALLLGLPGTVNGAIGTTAISCVSDGATAFKVSATGSGTAILGAGPANGVGVKGNNTTGTGVEGFSTSGVAVKGTSTSSIAVHGIGTGGAGVVGESVTDSGVYGHSGAANGVFGKVNNGAASGVYGQNDGGGYGVAGRSTGGTGMYGETASGVGVQASSTGTGRALHVEGRATFKGSGSKAIAVGTKSGQVNPGLTLSASSKVLCTLESNQVGLAVERVFKDVETNTFWIYLTGPVAVGKTAKAAWFLIG